MKNLTDQLNKHFLEMCKSRKLFRVNVSGSDIWDTYLANFEVDPQFRDLK